MCTQASNDAPKCTDFNVEFQEKFLGEKNFRTTLPVFYELWNSYLSVWFSSSRTSWSYWTD